MFKKTDEELVKGFYSLKTNDDLADLLEVKKKSLLFYAYSRKNFYKTFLILKRNGTYREIHAPVNELKVLQKKIAYILNLVYQPKDNVYGFVKNKNSLENAKRHIKKQAVLCIDLKDYFYQFHFGRVKGTLESGPYNVGKEAAITLANLVCIKRRNVDGSYSTVLPQGAPTSPVLTNMICKPFDNDMIKFAKQNYLIYSRYADDIVLSSNNIHQVESLIVNSSTSSDGIILDEKLLSIFTKHKLAINHSKTKYRKKYYRQMVTGIIVNDHPNIKREYYREIRSILYHCEKDSVYSTAQKYAEKNHIKLSPDQAIVEKWFKNVIQGKINYIGFVTNKSGSYYVLASKANKVFADYHFDLSNLYNESDIAHYNVFIIRDKDQNQQGSAFVVPGCGVLTCSHALSPDNSDLYYDMFNFFTDNERYDISVCSNIEFDQNKYPYSVEGDYAIFLGADKNFPYCKKIHFGDSDKLNIGDPVVLIGYPDYVSGTYTRIEGTINNKSAHLGHPIFTISETIIHGYSGGIVINSEKEVVGIVAAGISRLDANSEENIRNKKYGFIPINYIKEHVKTHFGIDI